MTAKPDATTRRALDKAAAGKSLTVKERRALNVWRKAEQERERWKIYESIPLAHYRAMSGREGKVLKEQAARYDLPIAGRKINLPAVLRAFHDLLAKNAKKLAADDDDEVDGMAAYRRERTALARLERQARERELIPRDEVVAMLGRIAAHYRAAGEALARAFGDDALDMLVEAITDSRREIRETLGGDDGE